MLANSELNYNEIVYTIESIYLLFSYTLQYLINVDKIYYKCKFQDDIQIVPHSIILNGVFISLGTTH